MVLFVQKSKEMFSQETLWAGDCKNTHGAFLQFVNCMSPIPFEEWAVARLAEGLWELWLIRAIFQVVAHKGHCRTSWNHKCTANLYLLDFVCGVDGSVV